MISDEAQAMAAALHYAPLPAPVRDLVSRKVTELQIGGSTP